MVSTMLSSSAPTTDSATRWVGDEQRGEDDAAIGDHLQCPGAPAARLLQVDGEDADAAQTGLMTDEHEQADAGKQAAKYRGQQGIEAFETNEMRQGFGKNREQADRTEGLHGESLAEGAQPKGIKRQVDQEVEQTEGQVADVIGEKSQPGRSAGEHFGLTEKHDGEGEDQGAAKKRLDIFEQMMTVGSLRHGGKKERSIESGARG